MFTFSISKIYLSSATYHQKSRQTNTFELENLCVIFLICFSEIWSVKKVINHYFAIIAFVVCGGVVAEQPPLHTYFPWYLL